MRKDAVDTAGLALGALALFLALAQQALHGDDVQGLIAAVQRGQVDHLYHHLYLRIGTAVQALVRPLGLGPAQALRFASALGTAIGIALLHRAALATLPSRRDALLATAWCAVLPGPLHFATVAEIHGVFFAFAALATASFCTARRPALRAALTGAAAGLAAAVHATGHLLALLFTAWFFAVAPRPARRRRTAALAPVLGASQLAVAAALGRAVQSGAGGAPFTDALRFVKLSAWRYGQVADAIEPLRASWREWLWPFCPAAALALVALARRQLRPLALAVHAAVVAYLGVATLLLFGADEKGAYLLPLAFPAAALAVLALPRRLVLPLVLGTLALAAVVIRRGDAPRQDAALGRAIAELARDEHFVLLCGARAELDTVAVHCPEVPATPVFNLAFAPEQSASFERFGAAFDQWVATLRAQGTSLWLSDSALAWLRRRDDPVLGRFAREHLEVRWQLERVESAALRAWRVAPRE